MPIGQPALRCSQSNKPRTSFFPFPLRVFCATASVNILQPYCHAEAHR